MNKVEGLHHLAISAGDMKAQIEFFTDKLGMELVALYWMHGVANTFHGFLRLNDESAIALVHNPAIAKLPITLGLSHAGNPAANSAPGTMQHVALRVSGEAELMAMRDRLRDKGVPVLGPLDHGMCKSIYFAGPENLSPSSLTRTSRSMRAPGSTRRLRSSPAISTRSSPATRSRRSTKTAAEG